MNKPCEDCGKESKKVWAYGLDTQAIICEECFDERAGKCKHTKGWTRWDCRPDECKECMGGAF